MDVTPSDATDLVLNSRTYWQRLKNCLRARNTQDDKYIAIAGFGAVHAILAAGGLIGPFLHVFASLSWSEQVITVCMYRWLGKKGPDYYINFCQYLARGLVLRVASRIEARKGYDAAQRFLAINGEAA